MRMGVLEKQPSWGTHELDGDARSWVGRLEVVDELRQVFDGVDVVVGGRRDQAHAGGRVARARDVALDLHCRTQGT